MAKEYVEFEGNTGAGMNGYIKKQALMDYCSNQVTKTIDLNDIARFPISEVFTKADMVAMLTEIQLEIEEIVKEEELIDKKWANGLHYSEKIIQQKIDALKGEL